MVTIFSILFGVADITHCSFKCYFCESHFKWRVSIGKVVDDGQRLLEAWTTDTCISDQLTHSFNHLEEKKGKNPHRFLCLLLTFNPQTGQQAISNFQLSEHIYLPTQMHLHTKVTEDYLQVWADDALALCKLKVPPHEEVEQCSGFGLCGAGAMATALQDLITQTATQIRFTQEKCGWKLKRKRTWKRVRDQHRVLQGFVSILLLFNELSKIVQVVQVCLIRIISSVNLDRKIHFQQQDWALRV